MQSTIGMALVAKRVTTSFTSVRSELDRVGETSA